MNSKQLTKFVKEMYNGKLTTANINKIAEVLDENEIIPWHDVLNQAGLDVTKATYHGYIEKGVSK